MRKIKLLIASMIGAIALVFACVVGTRVNAETTNDVYKATIDSTSVTATVVGGTKTMTFTNTGLKTGAGCSGTSLITGASTSFATGAKLNSSGSLSFTTTHSWSAQVLFASGTADQGIQSTNGTVSNPASTASKVCGVATITNGTAGNVTITRNGSKELWIFEIVVTESYDSDVTYRSITYYDSDETTVLGSDSVADGSKISALADPISSSLGQEFDCWVDSDGNEFDFANTTVTADLSLYASYKTDANYAAAVESQYSLSSSLIEYMLDGGYTTLSSEVSLSSTIYSIGANAKVEKKDSNTTIAGKSFIYDIATTGTVQKTSKYVKINAPVDGVLVAYVKNGSSTDARSVNLFTPGTQTQVDSNAAFELEANGVARCEFKVEAGKSYTFGAVSGGSVYIYELDLIPESVTPLAQKATVSDYTYVRFVTIIKGVEEIDTSDVTFSVTMDYADADKDDKTVIYTPHVVKKITQSGETYVADVNNISHTFDNSVNPTEYYVVYVLRFTTSKFSGNSIKATTTFGGTPYESNSIEI